MNRDLILAIDHGTQSVRALIFDCRGNLKAKSRVDIESYSSPSPGFSEQNPNYFWKAVCQACQKLFKDSKDYKESLAGVALTTQRSTIINVDEKGVPLRPAITWMDQRRTSGLKPVGGLWGLLFRLSGMTETVSYLQAEAEGNWIQTYQPDIWAKTHKYLLLSGFLTFRLIGEYKDSKGCQVGYIPFDYKNKAWCQKNDWKWQVVPVKKCMLPDLVNPTEILGHITAEASAETGIPAGLPLVAAAADKACEVIGAGCLEPNVGCLSYGTTATINTTHRKYIEVIPLIPPYPSAIPEAYSLEIQIFRGFWMVAWFKREFAYQEVSLAQEKGIEPEELFDDLVTAVPAGSLGLILQPYWSPGLKSPGPEAKGAIIGFGDIHTRAHLYRSILEGIVFSLREGAERTSRRSGIPITDLRVVGGGSQSKATMQLTADIFGLPASKPHTYEASGLGAAIDAAVGLGMHPNFETAISEMTRISETYEPNLQNQRIYNDLFNEVYCKMYSRLKPLYEKIQNITNYPPK